MHFCEDKCMFAQRQEQESWEYREETDCWGRAMFQTGVSSVRLGGVNRNMVWQV